MVFLHGRMVLPKLQETVLQNVKHFCGVVWGERRNDPLFFFMDCNKEGLMLSLLIKGEPIIQKMG